MAGLGVGLRAAVAFAVLAIAQPAFAQTHVKEKPPRPPLDIKPALKDTKPAKVAHAKAKPHKSPEQKPAEAPAGPTLASASSTPVILPPAGSRPAAVPMMPDLRSSIATAPHAYARLTPSQEAMRAELSPIIARHAAANGIPEALVHRVVMRESRYQPKLIGSCRCYGLMQIKHGTARAMGYDGPASGLLDPETNLTYAIKYLAGAYRKANGNADRAVAYYARGYQ